MRQMLAIAVLTITMYLGFGASSAHGCPATIPKPANAADCQCFASISSLRCGSGIPPSTCIIMQSTAWNAGLLTADGLTWLQTNGYCPVHYDVGDGNGDLIYSICPQGCFAGDTQILTDDTSYGKSGYTSASTLASMFTLPKAPSLMTMSDEASLREVTLTTRPLERFVYGPEEPSLFVFMLANGSTLRVTQHHPMVLSNGKIVEAAQVSEHASFVGIDGRRVAITSITREKTFDDVFNFETAGDTLLGHIIVAEGVLVGDLKLQNELENEQKSIQLRR